MSQRAAGAFFKQSEGVAKAGPFNKLGRTGIDSASSVEALPRSPPTRRPRVGDPISRHSNTYAFRAATTFEKTLEICPPIVSRITITTIDTKTRIKAYSTIPCPSWRRSPLVMGRTLSRGGVISPSRQ